ncbi:phosphopantetheine-binding protein [Labedaea rhizosphaerae]|uniref:Phosphopantetheine binding protein n=1 Tax=Labedaea rhizosphaerae TaxID=598644 RepID=A0A4R6S2U1_LABRH|nr:phosphopantetheine-binding protein [Labedaea rhizosphaerae]TDP92975.1 phosphopantetheine binding protein [Labedaea rhizosphaerae]
MNPIVDEATDVGYQRPRDPVELWLARQWQHVLGFGVGIRDDFFGVGGNSLDAALVINGVLEEFGIQLPLNVMTERPTVAALAALLREQNARVTGPLLTIQDGDGSKPPLFLVHPVDGQLGVYGHLAQALGDEYTLHGLQAAGFWAGTSPLDTVADLARAYLDAIRAEQATGPYLLGATTSAAAVAHELAVLLGDEVRLLAVLDDDLLEPAPGPVSSDPVEALAVWRAHDLVPEDTSVEAAERMLRVRQSIEDAVRGWPPRPHPGVLDLFTTASGPSTVDLPAAEVRVHECAPDDQRLAVALRELIG